jgi:hypothetical protein
MLFITAGMGAGAATHAGGDEQHVRAGNGTADFLDRQFGRFAAFLGLAARTQPCAAKLNGAGGQAAREGLRVGVGAQKFHPLHLAGDHVVHSVAAAASDTNDLDLGALVEFFDFDHFDAHGVLLVLLPVGGNYGFRCGKGFWLGSPIGWPRAFAAPVSKPGSDEG